MPTLTVGSLFSGIGGIDLGLERTGGFRTAWFAETDDYCSRVLARHWPTIPNLGDVRAITSRDVADAYHSGWGSLDSGGRRLGGSDDGLSRGQEAPGWTRVGGAEVANTDGGGTGHVVAPAVDVLAGGFPCQPVSLAGKRLGAEDGRWLWPSFARLVGLLRPRVVLVENVPGLASKGLRDVVADLSTLGYDAEWDIVSAAAVGAPHLRERLFVVAYPHGHGREGEQEHDGTPEPGVEVQLGNDADGLRDALADPVCPGSQGVAVDTVGPYGGHRPSDGGAPLAHGHGLGRQRGPGVFWKGGGTEPAYGGPVAGEHWALEPDVGRVAHGVPDRTHRLRALGNGVVPQAAQFVGHLILDAMKEGRL